MAFCPFLGHRKRHVDRCGVFLFGNRQFDGKSSESAGPDPFSFHCWDWLHTTSSNNLFRLVEHSIVELDTTGLNSAFCPSSSYLFSSHQVTVILSSPGAFLRLCNSQWRHLSTLHWVKTSSGFSKSIMKMVAPNIVYRHFLGPIVHLTQRSPTSGARRCHLLVLHWTAEKSQSHRSSKPSSTASQRRRLCSSRHGSESTPSA